MDAIKVEDGNVYKLFMKNEPSTWNCHLFDEFFKSDHMTNNMTKSWNEVLNDHQRKPLIDLLKFIYLKIMKKLIQRGKKVANWM